MPCGYLNENKESVMSGVYCDKIGSRPGLDFYHKYCSGDHRDCPHCGGSDPYELLPETRWRREEQERRQREEQERQRRREQDEEDERERARLQREQEEDRRRQKEEQRHSDTGSTARIDLRDNHYVVRNRPSLSNPIMIDGWWVFARVALFANAVGGLIYFRDQGMPLLLQILFTAVCLMQLVCFLIGWIMPYATATRAICWTVTGLMLAGALVWSYLAFTPELLAVFICCHLLFPIGVWIINLVWTIIRHKFF